MEKQEKVLGACIYVFFLGRAYVESELAQG